MATRVKKEEAAGTKPTTAEVTPAHARLIDPWRRPGYYFSIGVRNVRCFGDETQTLNLSTHEGKPAQWTLLLGNNGVGKTTILQAIALGTIVCQDFSSWGTRQDSDQGAAVVTAASRACRFLRGDGATKAGIHLRYAAAKDLSSATQSREAGVEITQDDWGTQCSRVGSVPGCFAYGASRRMGEGAITASWQESIADSLFDPNVPLRNAEEWLAMLDWSSRQDSRFKKRQKQRLDQVENLLVGILPDVEEIQLAPPAAANGRPQFKFKTPYGAVTLRQLGFGYQTMIAWMVDLASRMVERYPQSDDPLAQPAVVLVDEIDLHMHPQWQRDVMTYLSQRFPNTQFIATAHSPLVVQAAASVDANIAVLRREGDHVVIDNAQESVRGWRVDQILTSDLYGLPSARAREYDELLEERTRLLSKPRLTARDKTKLKKLNGRMEQLPVGDTAGEVRDYRALAQKTAALLAKLEGTKR